MPLDPAARIEVTAFGWVPPVAAGLVKDMRVRWALEEAGLAYRTRLIRADAARSAGYLTEQPFGQVPAYRDGALQLFESGAIVQHIGEGCEALLQRDAVARARAIQWSYAALSSIEPFIQQFGLIIGFFADEEWAKLARPRAEEMARLRLGQLSDWLRDREWLEGRFTIGDLMMVTVLRILRDHDIMDDFPGLRAYRARGEARPAFARALADHLADLGGPAAA